MLSGCVRDSQILADFKGTSSSSLEQQRPGVIWQWDVNGIRKMQKAKNSSKEKHLSLPTQCGA